MELNLDAKEVGQKVILNGKTYDIKFMSVRAQLEMQRELKGLDKEDPAFFENTVKHLSKLGLPENVIYDMSSAQLTAFVEFISAQEKK